MASGWLLAGKRKGAGSNSGPLSGIVVDVGEQVGPMVLAPPLLAWDASVSRLIVR